MRAYRWGHAVLIAADGPKTVPQPLYDRSEWKTTTQADYETDGQQVLLYGKSLGPISRLKRIPVPHWARSN